MTENAVSKRAVELGKPEEQTAEVDQPRKAIPEGVEAELAGIVSGWPGLVGRIAESVTTKGTHGEIIFKLD